MGSYQAIAGYEPTPRVTDHAAIDLDMDIILQTLGTEFNDAFDIVAGIYSQGGNSKSYAKLTLNQPVTQVIEKGTNVQGGNGNNEVVLGKVLEKVNIVDSVLKFQYETSDNQKNYVKCRVGALPVENQDTRGCLKILETFNSVTPRLILITYTINPLIISTNVPLKNSHLLLLIKCKIVLADALTPTLNNF